MTMTMTVIDWMMTVVDLLLVLIVVVSMMVVELLMKAKIWPLPVCPMPRCGLNCPLPLVGGLVSLSAVCGGPIG